MKTTITKCMIILAVLAVGFQQTSFSQCVSEDNVYSFDYMDKKYEVIKEQKNWSEAAICAVERGGYLAMIDSREEQDTIYGAIIYGALVTMDYTSVADGGGIAYVWIGASDQAEEGTWIWDGDGDNGGLNFWTGEGAAGQNNGSAVDDMYNNWGGTSAGNPNEPDDFGSGQDGAAIALAKWPSSPNLTLGLASEWNDISSENSLYFVVEIDCQPTSSTVEESSCGSFVSPGGKIWTESGNYHDTLMNIAGCDSVISFNLTIITLDTTLIQNGATLTSTVEGADYRWLDCDAGYSLIEGETSHSYTALINGRYALEITSLECTDTSNCHAVTSLFVNEKPLVEQIKVYPGSDRHLFHIDMGSIHQDVGVQVSDLHGRLIKNQSFHQSQLLSLDLESPSGIYFFTITTPTQQAVIKLIKN